MIEYKLIDEYLVIKAEDGFSRFSIYEIEDVCPNGNLVTILLTNGSESEYEVETSETAAKISGGIGRLLYDQF